MKIAYFDCFSGAAGDMIVAAMLDAGLDEAYLCDQIASMGMEGLAINVTRVKRCGMSAVYFAPVVTGHQHHRGLDDIVEIIGRSAVNDTVKQRAIAIFEILAEVEGNIHGKGPREIHFHEVGAVDSIVDIVGACVGLEALGVDRVCCSAISVGGGVVQCAHGTMPVPAPATAELLKRAHAPVVGGPVDAELLTPTAAAFIARTASGFGSLPSMRIEGIGYGAGTREFKQVPNVLRMVIGSGDEEDTNTDTVCLLECNVDDADGETIGHAVDVLRQHGALEVFTTPVYMKSSRPAVQLSVLVEPAERGKFETLIFAQGLTLGIRRQMLERSVLARKWVSVDTEYGPIRVKTGVYGEKQVFVKPEFADCSSTAAKRGISLKRVHEAAMAAYLHNFDSQGRSRA